MRNITSESVSAFMDEKPFKKSNMEVEVRPDVTILKLFGNSIAYMYKDSPKDILITNCGWFTKVTKERLNALPNVKVYQKGYNWYLNGHQWNGEITSVNYYNFIGHLL